MPPVSRIGGTAEKRATGARPLDGTVLSPTISTSRFSAAVKHERRTRCGAAYRLVESAGHSFRLLPHYGLRPRHLPLLLGLAAVVHSFEVPSMLRALGGRTAGPTVYR